MTQDHHLALPIGHRIGKYEINRVLGSGGFAITYLAIDVELKRKVAIKELLPGDLAYRLPDLSVAPKSPAERESLLWARERFLDEARTIARFDHPNLVHVHEHFEKNNTAYIVMGCIEGSDLNDHLKGLVPVPVIDMVSLIDPLLGALGIMHASGFLHRDIKPDNVRVTPEGVPVLIDFGSARHAIGAHTRDLTTILTPRYAPFEQYSEKGNLGSWTDIYSLAAVMHKMMRGTAPPEAPERERNDPYLPLAGDPNFAHYPQSFLAAIDQALHPLETKRPQSTTEWRELLWAEIDLPTGFTRVPSGHHFPESPTIQKHTPPNKISTPEPTPVSTPSTTTPAPHSRTPLIIGGSLIALIAISFGAYSIYQKQPRDPEVKDPSPTTETPTVQAPAIKAIKPEPTPEPETEPTFRPTDPDPLPNPIPPIPTPSGYSAEGAQVQYAGGDSLLFDIRKSIEIRKSSMDRLNTHNQGLADPPFSDEEVAILQQSITSRDHEITSLSERALSILETLKKWPASLRQEGYQLRLKHLILSRLEKGMDTRLQQSLLSVFHDLCDQSAAGTRVNRITIESKVSQVPIPD